ncbi:unnamed protein product [Camellia sinensis]
MVFLSFRGKDTRKTFTDHLYTALVQVGIHTFRDDEEIEKGENIELELKKAIEQSRISVIVLSKDYASSSWCLDELVKILDCRKKFGHVIVPIFYGIEPSQVRNQIGSLAEAFARQEDGLKVERWTQALTEVADLGGMVLQNHDDGFESKFIQKIVKEIGNKLNRTILSVAPYPIGIDSRVKNINLWLQDGSTHVGIFVIYGMGGIGKTTIAKAVYNLNFDKFESCSFLSNIRETSEQPNGLIRLQKKLLSDILKGKKEKIYNVDKGITRIKDAVCSKRVLIILDDVDELRQLNAVLVMRDWFYSGSKIIITTRNERLLKAHEVCELHKVKELDDNESLQLFSWHAFKQDHPLEAYVEHSKRVIEHCGGLPLALQVLGCSLSGKDVNVWESALQKLKAIPDNQILKKLRISYDSLDDDHDKDLFLDIACFFIGKDRNYMLTILKGCDFYAGVGIQNLINKCLITIDNRNKLMMHQLLRDMGREVICQESPEEPGERSRLWDHKDSFNVLNEKTGTGTVEGLVLNMHMLKHDNSSKTTFSINNRKRHHVQEYSDNTMLSVQGNSLKRRCLGFLSWLPTNTGLFPVTSEIDLKTNAFVEMQNLRLLLLSYVQLTGSYKEFPKKLKWLCWRGFPLKSIPINFPLECIVALEMRNSSLEQVWKGTKSLGLLKILDLSHSHCLTKTPDFSGFSSLERLILKGCVRLVGVHESIGDLEGLVFLNLRGCKNLRELPVRICMLKSLEELILSDCSKLDKLPEELWRMESLKVLNADGTAINQLSCTTRRVNLWVSFFWSCVSKPRISELSLASLPRFLVILSLMDCNLSDDALPRDLSNLHSLQKLYLGGNTFHSLPESVKFLTTLQSLHLDLCRSLRSLPELPSSLRRLNAESCASLERITNLPNWLRSLNLDLCDCTELVEIQGMFWLEPITKVDARMINNLGLVNLDTMGNIELDLYNNLTQSGKKGPTQGFYEFGIFSTLLSASEVPSWFSNKSKGSSVSFTVPSLDLKIGGLNFCVVYTLPDYDGGWAFDENYLGISNETKGLNWTYAPMFFGMPEVNKHMIWLSHWKFGNQLEGGDQVNVSFDMNAYFQVKECGVHLVYDQEEKVITESSVEEVVQICTYPCYQNVIDGDLSAYRTSGGLFLLCHYDCMMRRRCSIDGCDIDEYETTDEEFMGLFGWSVMLGSLRICMKSDRHQKRSKDGWDASARVSGMSKSETELLAVATLPDTNVAIRVIQDGAVNINIGLHKG